MSTDENETTLEAVRESHEGRLGIDHAEHMGDEMLPLTSPAVGSNSNSNSDFMLLSPSTSFRVPSSVDEHSNYQYSLMLEQAIFFACGLGSSICYIATLSSLVYFKILYGPNSFVYLNLAVYLPLVPVSIAQARYDQYYDAQYASRNTFFARGVIGFGLNLFGTVGMILQQRSENGDGSSSSLLRLIWDALLQGTGGAILYGTLNQMASFVSFEPGGDRKLKTVVSAGVQASALVVLAVSFFTGFGVHEASCFPSFLWTITFLECLCFALFIWLLVGRPNVAAAMIRRDSSLRFDVGDDENEVFDDEGSSLAIPLIGNRTEQSFSALWQRTKGCCLVLAVTLIPSFLVGSWFTRVQTDWMALASVLFYTRIGADFLGRLATILVPPRNLSVLKRACCLRLGVVVLFFGNAHHSFSLRGVFADTISIVLVGVIAFLSGYLVTACFQLAPILGLQNEERETNVAKQASLLTVAFSISAILGLLSSFTLMGLGLKVII